VSSSAVKNPSKFTPPWSFSTSTSSPDRAWSNLLNQVSTLSGFDIITEVEGEGWKYLHLTVPTIFPPGDSNCLDDLQFVMRVVDGLVLVRSSSRRSVFVYPLQQQVGDKDSNRKRMEGIRRGLNWAEMG
jgi:hypothetical protein